ncbi:hypothetical protein [Arenicella xantha]|nr:hypothetical protein [Arenicella xantha]
MSVIWHGEHSPYVVQAAISGFMDIPAAASGMASPPEQYFYFGRFTLLFYVAIFLNIIKIKQAIRPRIVLISVLFLSIALIGDIATYWLSDIYGAYLRRIGFWYAEFPALIILLAYWFSLASYQSIKSRKPQPMIWLLPLTILAIGCIQYLPHSFLLVILIVVSFKPFTQSSN